MALAQALPTHHSPRNPNPQSPPRPPRSENCTFLIDASASAACGAGGAGCTIDLTFSGKTERYMDVVLVYVVTDRKKPLAGKSLGYFDGDMAGYGTQPFETPTGMLAVTFTSDGKGTYAGWSAAWAVEGAKKQRLPPAAARRRRREAELAARAAARAAAAP